MSSVPLAVVGLSPLPPNSNPDSIFNNSSRTNRRQLISLLQRCKHVNQILQIHVKVIKLGHEQDPFVVFELLRLCSTFNSIDYATKIFYRTQNPNVYYLYTALNDGFALSGCFLDGIRLYSRMVHECIVPDTHALTSILKACGFQLALKEGKEVHGRVLKLWLSSNRLIRMRMMEHYGKCGEFEDAQRLFDEMPEGDVVASTVMISSYATHGLVDCASDIFNGVQTKDTVCWTAMIDGFVRNGEMNRALVLWSCLGKCRGRIWERWILELSYLGKYEIELNHFVGSALINMYSRCGSIDEADACKIHGNLELGEHVAKILMNCGDADSGTYVLLSNVYASSGKWKEAAQWESLISKGVTKDRDGEVLYDQKEPMNFMAYVTEDYKMIADSAMMEPDADVDNKMIDSSVGREICVDEGGQMLDIYDETELIVREVDDNVEPYIGMEFDSEEAAMIYYDAYAKQEGFIIRVGNCHRSGRDGSVISRRFLCNKEGFRVNNKKTRRLEVRKPREITREGCKAMIMVRKEKSGKWVVTKIETEHSHPLGIPAGKGRRGTVQARPQDEKDKKIRELSAELHRANQQLAECREQLEMVLKDIERHTNHLTKSVHDIVENVREVEAEDEEQSY
ncbi:hypothetical protein L1049_004298 [Liquidambar formosana]|uniref:FAR1 domain-containing protein n=1 Tax=Liquidambar formosana TaxID=63359 RepID=A0AAP0RP94_LIQFO